VNENYQGLGNFFANPWSVLIVLKHVVVLAFLVLGISSERAFLRQISARMPEALRQFRRSLNLTTALGVLVLLITALAQAG
jgi:putative copper export protein